ncbi:hypothetical protein [Priestia megaterium]|uniref:hypothetical protein n=1 Tax=Priestia megaterium TaxID=1404 RepID=UPI001F140ECF|nr:hypothetical protein [Priestia megaterium]UMZ35532.1 hypothetical protein MGJ28_12935 [Priestia megaterium]
MLTTTYVSQFVHSVIKKVWLEDISKDYEKLYLLKEDSLKNAFYSHLRRRLGDDFLEENNIRIFTEYYIGNQKADLSVVEIDPNMAKGKHLKECITKVISIVEMKHKDENASESHFDNDVLKVLSYINTAMPNTMHYVAFIREKYFYADEVTNWVTSEQALEARGSLTEMYSYGDVKSGSMVWGVIEH